MGAVQRVNDLEQSVGDAAERHAKAQQVAHESIDKLHGRIAEHHRQLVAHALAEDRLTHVEETLGSSTSKSESLLDDIKAQQVRNATEMNSVKARQDRSVAQLESIDAQQNKNASDVQRVRADQATLTDRVNNLEKLCGDLTQMCSTPNVPKEPVVALLPMGAQGTSVHALQPRSSVSCGPCDGQRQACGRWPPETRSPPPVIRPYSNVRIDPQSRNRCRISYFARKFNA